MWRKKIPLAAPEPQLPAALTFFWPIGFAGMPATIVPAGTDSVTINNSAVGIGDGERCPHLIANIERRLRQLDESSVQPSVLLRVVQSQGNVPALDP